MANHHGMILTGKITALQFEAALIYWRVYIKLDSLFGFQTEANRFIGEDMTDRIYRLIVGAILLISLYFNLQYLIYALIIMMLFEGITNWRIPLIINKMRGANSNLDINANSNYSVSVEAERIWRLFIGLTFAISFVLFPGQLWIVPWFLAFVIFGAGASDVCPGLLAVKKLGCK